MRNFLITLGLVLGACAAGFGAFYVLGQNRALHTAAVDGDAMAWLRTEFRLDEQQFATIRKLHEDYSSVCSQHCAAIMAARERHAPPAEVTALEQTCVNAMTAHFRQVAALMPAGEGERYLAMVLPRVAGYAHHGPPDMRAKP